MNFLVLIKSCILLAITTLSQPSFSKAAIITVINLKSGCLCPRPHLSNQYFFLKAGTDLPDPEEV